MKNLKRPTPANAWSSNPTHVRAGDRTSIQMSPHAAIPPEVELRDDGPIESPAGLLPRPGLRPRVS